MIDYLLIILSIFGSIFIAMIIFFAILGIKHRKYLKEIFDFSKLSW